MSVDRLGYPHREPEQIGEDIRLRNWARNATLGTAGSVVAPVDEADLQAVLSATSGTVRMIGSRMSPGRMIDLFDGDGTLLDLGSLSGLLSITDETATFAGATPLEDVYA